MYFNTYWNLSGFRLRVFKADRTWAKYIAVGFGGISIFTALLISQNFVYNRWETSLAKIIPRRLYKYLPLENGGNTIFPVTQMYSMMNYKRTQYNSFDQRSYFPHSDSYKLMVAICENDRPLAEAVIDRNPELLKKQDFWKDTTPLGLAAMLNRSDMCEYLIDRGASPNVKGSDSNTPLMLAVMQQNQQIVKVLLLNGASKDLKDKFGFTAETKATKRGYLNIADYIRSVPTSQTVRLTPITPYLESFDYLKKQSGMQLYADTNPKHNMIFQLYPYYSRNQAYHFYSFGKYRSKNIGIAVRDFTMYNKLDDKGTSYQQLFAMGAMFDAVMKENDLSPDVK